MGPLMQAICKILDQCILNNKCARINLYICVCVCLLGEILSLPACNVKDFKVSGVCQLTHRCMLVFNDLGCVVVYTSCVPEPCDIFLSVTGIEFM